MPLFRKKPVEVEAIQFTGNNFWDCAAFIGTHELALQAECHTTDWPVIETREGNMVAEPGDWIIREPFQSGDRKFYPCKPDIFEATYEPVEEPR